ncbi:MAG: STT3 domain-containing protein [Candidatus Omnitrophota bacterium]
MIKQLFTIKKLAKTPVVRKIALIAVFSFCIGINLYLRMFLAYFPQLKTQARTEVENKISKDSIEKAQGLFPDYNSYAQDEMAVEFFKEAVKGKKIFNRQVSEKYTELKSKYQDETGQTYLLELDPYQWMRYTENVVKYGHPGDRKVKGKSYDTHMLAPVGMHIGPVRFLFYFSAHLYKAITFFYKGLSFYKYLFYLPLFYTFVFLFIVYVFSVKLFSHWGAFVATLFIGLNSIFIRRSCAGWYDYDTLSLIVPLLLVWCLFTALSGRVNLRRLTIYSIIASFLQGLYSFTWVGWWFIFLVVSCFFLCMILNNYCLYYKDLRNAHRQNAPYFISAIIFTAGSILFCFLISRINLLTFIISSIKENLNLGKSLSVSIWPNTNYTIGELKPADMLRIAENLHGLLMFVLSLFGMLWFYSKEKRGRRKDFVYIMLFWFLFMIFASSRSIRFVIYLAVPLGFFLGGFTDNIVKIIGEKKYLKVGFRHASYIGFFLAICLFTWIVLSSGIKSCKQVYPLMDDGWHRVLMRIRAETPSNAVVNSWWDYGNFFKTTAGRRVIFDGQSQSGTLTYWMGKALVSEDENSAMRILRMINNASDGTFNSLNSYIIDPYKTLGTLEQLLLLDRDKGENLLRKNKIPANIISKVMDDLHKVPDPAYFIVDSTMVGKMSPISFLGNWDVKKLYIYKNINESKADVLNALRSIFGLSPESAQSYYNEITITPEGKPVYESLSQRYFYNGYAAKATKTGNLIHFDNGFLYNFDAKQGILYSIMNLSFKKPKTIVVTDEHSQEKIKTDDGDYERAVWMFKVDDQYQSIILNEPLANSLFSRLYFIKGRGLKCFTPFIMDTEAKIFVYKIEWDKACEDADNLSE